MRKINIQQISPVIPDQHRPAAQCEGRERGRQMPIGISHLGSLSLVMLTNRVAWNDKFEIARGEAQQ
jgi:hypothetical protein